MSRPRPSHTPRLLAAQPDGAIIDLPRYAATGIDSNAPRVPSPDEFIPLPEGSSLFTLPGRLPVGYDEEKQSYATVSSYRRSALNAVAAFVAPAHTSLLRPAYTQKDNAPLLPLYAYSAVGWADDMFWVTAMRIDPSPRQDADMFDEDAINAGAENLLETYPNNRLVHHLITRCCRCYRCPAARNFALGRSEMPLPTARACNSSCIGCISFQPGDHVCAAQERISFAPTAEEITQIVVPHFTHAESPIASFGQGCEGEPLTETPLITDAITAIRRETDAGTINLNTNGSYPTRIATLSDAGLDSIRISLNSAQERYYSAYFRPHDYTFDDVLASLKTARDKGLFISLNYFVLPGFTNTPDEHAALLRLLETYHVDMIQWRNLTIDPAWYLNAIGVPSLSSELSVTDVIASVRTHHPSLVHGYFNPPVRHTT